MIVISDTTPLNYLILIGAIDVLPQLFAEVHAPNAVLQELRHPKAPQAVQTWASAPAPWLKVRCPASILASTSRLDPGEANAISLARELNIRDILIDERRGSNVARAEGLFPVPTLAVIERAAEKNLLHLPTAIARLQQTTIRIAPEHFLTALQRDAERKQSKRAP